MDNPNDLLTDQDLGLHLLVDEQPSQPQVVQQPQDEQDSEGDIDLSEEEPESDDGDDSNSDISDHSQISREPILDDSTKYAEMIEKRRILRRLKRYEIKKGITLDRAVSMHTSLEELRMELDLVKREANIDNSIEFSKAAIVMCCSGIEYLNKAYDPLDLYLDGWSASVEVSIDDYEDILEDLYDKYYNSVNAAPEIKLILGLVMSAVLYNISHKAPGAIAKHAKKQKIDRTFNGPSKSSLADELLYSESDSY